jgi:gliding motility-related protein
VTLKGVLRSKKIKRTLMVVLVICLAGYALALPFVQDNRGRRQNNRTQRNANTARTRNANTPQNNTPQRDVELPTLPEDEQPEDTTLVIDNEDAPETQTNDNPQTAPATPLWRVQPTTPTTYGDLWQNAMDLKRPDNMKQGVEYNDTLDRYLLGTKWGRTYLGTPIMMTPDEYRRWSERQARNSFFRKKNDEIYKAKGKEKFDFTDMHFDLGPAEKIFGPGGVRIKTQGSAEIRFGATLKNIDNPSIPIRNRKTTTINFDEKININMNGKVGDKVNMNLNYNTDATFDFDAQSLKLKYDGKEDEIIKLVEAGNVSFPANSSLIKGASSLFGIRTDLQFGKLKLQLVASQKKSSSKSVSSRGGVQLTPFELDAANYEENRHFFLSHYFRDKYDEWMASLPTVKSGISINRVEVWVTNKTGTTTNTRNIVALTDLGEVSHISNLLWSASGLVPANNANSEYPAMVSTYVAARNIDQTSTTLDGIAGFVGGNDYEKLQNARLLQPSEYTVNTTMGYISLRQGLQTDQVLAVAYEYTYGGNTYQVGEFAADNTDTNQALFVKSLKNTSNNPRQGNWHLMMKNVYYLATSVEKERFRLDIKYQSDTTGVYLTYIPETQVKDQPLIRVMGADRLDNNNKVHANGYFDFVEGYTISNGRVFLPKTQPFGKHLYNYLRAKGVPDAVARSYTYDQLYDSTKTIAKQIAEKNKFILTGQFRGTSANVISLGAYNVPQGSVVVTAGGVRLTEGVDYTVDYYAGEVTILNQSILDAGTAVNVSLESNTDYGQQRKTMFGLNWEYNFSKDLQLSGTLQHLTEQALTTKVNMGAEPLNNTLWGLNINWKKESQWLTNLLDKIPFLHVTQPSQISFTGEFAHLIAGRNKGTQDNASYLDDFETTKSSLDVSTPTSWTLASTPSMFAEHNDKATLNSGFNRSRLAWYTIDPLFTRRSSSLTPSHIKGDLQQLSNHYVREVPVRELFPKRDQNSYGGVSTLSVLNLAFYPAERGPYNFNPDLNPDGTLDNPDKRWGGMMRKLDTNDFEAANIEYIEFWMLDPFIYSNRQPNANDYGGDFYLNLGEVSEDVLRDGKKFYESGMPVDGSQSFVTTQWGKIPTQATTTYAFATSRGARALQDVGFNGLSDNEERSFPAYQSFLNAVRGRVNAAVFDSIQADPANDNYHYFRGSDYDRAELPILQRYKRINNPQGNSPDSDQRSESYDTSYKSTPDVEDINQDYTLNEYEKYYQYHVSLRPQDMVVGRNFIVDKREASASLRNGTNENVTWYQFRIPVREYEKRFGSISDFSSIRFMRMFLTGFKRPIVLRFGSLDLVRGEWRSYEQNLSNTASQTGRMSVSAVSYEENSDKTPVNYILPPGIERGADPNQPQMVENNEQALSLVVDNLGQGEAKAVYKNTTIDLRQYRRLQMFVHANALEPNATALANGELSVFIRLGSDYKNNFYEYDIPLSLTPAHRYNDRLWADSRAVWPEENMLDIALSVFTNLKKARNKARATGLASFTSLYSAYDVDKPKNKVSIMGNPTLGEVKTIIIGVRNNAATQKSGEVWVNELRLKEYENEGGWAAQGNLNVQLSDFGTLNLQGRYVSEGFGGLEDGVADRAKDNFKAYSVTTNLELGKFFPEKAKVSAPLYYSRTQEESSPKYNPLDTDLRLKDALDAANRQERDSIKSIAIRRTTNTNFSLSNVRIGIQNKRHPMPYDPANFSFSYSNSSRFTSGETTVYERENNWRAAMAYNWTPVYKPLEPFKNIKSKSKWLDILKRFGLNWLPQNLSFNSDINRSYYELQERDMESKGGDRLPLTFNSQFLWNRDFAIRWDLTRNLHANFQSATHAEVEQPYTPVNKDLYAERYQAWKDSVWNSIRNFGTPLDYNQSFTLSYQPPLNLLPIFNWVNADLTYNATYRWVRGTQLEDGSSLGNTIANNRDLNLNGTFDLVRLYNQIPFLKKANERFNREPNTAELNRKREERQAEQRRKAQERKAMEARMKGKGVTPDGQKIDNNETLAQQQRNELPKNRNSFEQEITLMPDSTLIISHNKRSKRLMVTARTEDGKRFPLKFKTSGENSIRIITKVDSALRLKLTVTPRQPQEKQSWYETAQTVARVLMMVRNVSISYRNQYAISLPGFMPRIGDAFGQARLPSALSPGLDFAFGLTDDSYINKARNMGWLLDNDSIATPAATTKTEDLQLRMTLEPVRNLKIDLHASRTQTTARNIQYMYAGTPTTQNGTFMMTTISIRSAFEGMGSAANGYRSASFERFCNVLDAFRNRVESQYVGARYPAGTSMAGAVFNPANGAVDRYSSDVMIPAFLNTYTAMGGSSLNIFPTLARLLPNWTLRYSGLGKLPWLRDHFKSVNINHGYKSIYAVGAYASYNTFVEYMNGLGFISDVTTGNPLPRSLYNVANVSINEAFSPLLGVDMTFNNNLTAKVEYRSTRVLNLSMTSVQINEAVSRDWVVGMGYRINNFKLFGMRAPRAKKTKAKRTDSNENTATSSSSQGNTNHDLNMRLDLSYRSQASISRDIATRTSAASSGNTAIKISFSADYTLSRLLTMSFFYDRQTNTPLLSSNSYPTTTQDFGLSLKFSLTR